MKSSSNVIKSNTGNGKFNLWIPRDGTGADSLVSSENVSSPLSGDNSPEMQSTAVNQGLNSLSGDRSFPKGIGVVKKWMHTGSDSFSLDTAGDLESVAKYIVKEAISQAREKVAEVESEANDKAEQIIQQAKMQASQISQEAREDGMAEAMNDVSPILSTANQMVTEIDAWHQRLMVESQDIVLDLVKEISSKLFGNGLQLEPDVLDAQFSIALEKAKSLGDLKIYAHPEDIAVIKNLWTDKAFDLSGSNVVFSPDNSVNRGGCLIKGQHGVLDARIESEMDLIIDTIDSKVNNADLE